ncbi:MAG: hypothetical protein WBV78_06280 [Roseobacter sp.]
MTAVCAAGASASIILTERGVTDTLVFTTAIGAHGRILPDSVRFTGPGTSTAFYLATRQGMIEARGVSGCAIILVTWPKDVARARNPVPRRQGLRLSRHSNAREVRLKKPRAGPKNP